jgi:1,4-alpha-glucan branching enzyme
MPKVNKSATATAVQTTPAPAQKVAAKTATSIPVTTPKANTANVVRDNQTKPLQPVSDPTPAKSEQEIILKYVSPTAREVKVAGNFNGWQPQATPLKNNGNGEWTVRLTLRAGHYEYRFVVDGHWVEDPHAAHRGPNPYGGFNSVLTVPPVARR